MDDGPWFAENGKMVTWAYILSNDSWFIRAADAADGINRCNLGIPYATPLDNLENAFHRYLCVHGTTLYPKTSTFSDIYPSRFDAPAMPLRHIGTLHITLPAVFGRRNNAGSIASMYAACAVLLLMSALEQDIRTGASLSFSIAGCRSTFALAGRAKTTPFL